MGQDASYSCRTKELLSKQYELNCGENIWPMSWLINFFLCSKAPKIYSLSRSAQQLWKPCSIGSHWPCPQPSPRPQMASSLLLCGLFLLSTFNLYGRIGLKHSEFKQNEPFSQSSEELSSPETLQETLCWHYAPSMRQKCYKGFNFLF